MNDPELETSHRIVRRHQVIGWWGLFVFMTLGIILETLHGFKVGFYLDPEHRLRRLLWTLAHAHGTLIALIQIAFAFSVSAVHRWEDRYLRLTSFLMIDGFVLVPLGFFLGGVGHTEVDPSFGVILVPIGAMLLLIAVALTAWRVTTATKP